MSTVKLRDGFGLVVDVSPNPLSVFLKYLKNPGVVTATLNNKKPIQGLQIGEDPFASQAAGFSFDKSIELGATGVDLRVKPELAGIVEIHKGEALFDEDDDPFRDKIPIPDQQHAFVGAGIQASVDVGLSGDSGDLGFGFSAGSETVLKNYRLFALNDQIVPAIQTLFQNFVAPGDLQDIESMPPGSVATVEGTGSLTFSASANLLSAVNPLATVNTVVAEGMLHVKEGGSLSVRAAYTVTGEYQVRIRRLAGRTFQLGYEKKRGSDFSVTAAAEVGASASLGAFDLIRGVLRAVSADPVPDKEVFSKAGLTDERISTIGAAVKTAIERSLELSLKSEFDFLDTTSTAFSYEIDLDALDANGRQAVHDALDGDLSRIEQSTLAGVKPLKSVFATLREGKKILKVNLLGIFNYGSVSTLFQKGTIIVDQQVGDITITDEVGANRIQFDSNNFARNSGKLRKVLAESFLVTVTYRASKTVFQAPTITTSYSVFELHQKANFSNIRDYLQIAEALKLISPEQLQSKLAQVSKVASFGPATLYLDSHYDDETFRALFLDLQGNARPQSEYEDLGRQAMAATIIPDASVGDARLRPLRDDALWGAMQEGTPTFPTVLGAHGFASEYIPAISSDYTAIKWWAGAMHDVGEALARVLEFFDKQPAADAGNHEVAQLRKELDKKLSGVAANTHDHFAEPWGFLVMDLASGRKAAIKLQINCSKLTLIAPENAAQTKTA
ncbi:MAG: hypothetical protein ACJ74Z_22840 [Bryobacteraceae bacterium]